MGLTTDLGYVVSVFSLLSYVLYLSKFFIQLIKQKENLSYVIDKLLKL